MPLDFPAIYPLIEDKFASFYGPDPMDGSLERDVLAGLRQLYIAVLGGRVKACALTEVRASGGVLVTHCAGEDAEEWGGALLSHFEKWADAEFKGRISVICRPGWVRVLSMKARGYQETHRIMERF